MSAPVGSTQPRPRAASRRPRRSRLGAFLRQSAVNGRLPALLLSIGLSVLTGGFLFSGDFSVRTVVVQGNSLAYADSVAEASGALGQSIFRLDTQEVAERVAAHPAVASVEVAAEFPNRIVVRLQERIPALVWQTGDQAVLVDERGWVIAEGFEPGLPRIVQVEGELPTPGTQLPPVLTAAVRAIEERLGERLAMLQYDRATGLAAQLTDGRSVIFGSTDRMPVKLAVVEAAESLEGPWTRLDVREPDRPYYQ